MPKSKFKHQKKTYQTAEVKFKLNIYFSLFPSNFYVLTVLFLFLKDHSKEHLNMSLKLYFIMGFFLLGMEFFH